jgi:hypothetical protein
MARNPCTRTKKAPGIGRRLAAVDIVVSCSAGRKGIRWPSVRADRRYSKVLATSVSGTPTRAAITIGTQRISSRVTSSDLKANHPPTRKTTVATPSRRRCVRFDGGRRVIA